MSMEIVAQEEDSDVLGPIPIHIGPLNIEGFEKLSRNVVKMGWKNVLLCFLYCLRFMKETTFAQQEKGSSLDRHKQGVI